MRKPELMSPAGNWVMLRVAVQNGADAIYLGVDKLNMRAKAKNFTISELPEVVSFCRENNVKVYLTVNSIILEDDQPHIDEVLTAAKSAGVDMIICWDIAVIAKCKQYSLPFCISTQASISNSASAKFYSELGAERIVLARECTLAEIKKIRNETLTPKRIEIETFIHGAMCIAVSGRCFLSHDIFNKSANQGDCMQPCRREYEIYDKRLDKSLLIGNDYVMSAKDLCTIEFLDQLIEADIDSFKIEGRKRSPEYVAKVTSVYRRAIDSYFDGTLTPEKKTAFLEELSHVYNRGFSPGFYFGKPGAEGFSSVDGNSSVRKKEFVGKVLNYYKKSGVCYVAVLSGTLQVGDELLIIGNTTGMAELKVSALINEETNIQTACRGDKVTFPCPLLVREGDQVYKIVN